MSDTKTPRRGFLGKGALLAAGLAAGAKADAAPYVPENKTGPKADLVTVGALSCLGHMGGLWAPLINPSGKNIRETGMIVTHCWDLDPTAKEAFGKKFNAVPVKNHTDLIGKVDAVISSDYYSIDVNHKMLEPFLEAGVPIFINRPFSTNLAGAKRMVETARKYKTPIMCTSSFEFTRDTEIAREEVQKIGKNIQGYSATNSMSDYSTHGIHGLYMLHRVVGGPLKAISYRTPDWKKPNGLMTFEHPDRDGSGTFYGTLQHIAGGLTNASFKVWKGSSNYFEQWWFWERGPFDRDKFMWIPMLIEMQRMFVTREMYEPYESILEKTLWYLAGFKSHLDKKGGYVELEGFDEEWKAPIYPSSNTFDYIREYKKYFG
ncbi:MAG: Gfo/Idh/MocA family oxidoreductase [Candidatus Latescibacterota bacterium]